MIPSETADRIRTFVSSLTGVCGFNLLLQYDDRVEMVGAGLQPEQAVDIMEAIVETRVTQAELDPITIN